jgi:amino acid adenylation domain-containing protein
MTVSAEIAERLKRLGREEGATLFMTLLAGFQTLLWRYTGQEDVVVGTPVANRASEEVEGMIGFFVNTLALRTEMSGDPTFRELLRRVREVALGAYAHQDAPFEKLVEELQPERNLNGAPLFNVMFALQNAPSGVLRLPELTLSPIQVEARTAKFDLSLDMFETSRGLGGAIDYQTDLFDRSTIERMSDHFTILLESVAANPDAQLSKLSMLSDEERRYLLYTVNATEADYPLGYCIHELFERQAERTPNTVAVVFQDQSLTYEHLNRRANRVAGSLRARGVGHGSYAPVLMDRSLELVVSLLAVMKAGAAFSPLDIHWPIERLRQALNDLGGELILVNKQTPYSEEELGGTFLLVDALSECEPAPNLNIRVRPHDPIYVIYTSGSTGRPKGVLTPHQGITNRFLWMNDYFGVEASVAALQTTRHVYDSAVWQIFWPLINGGRTIIPSAEMEMSADHLTALVERRGVTIMDLVPSVLDSVLTSLIEGAAVQDKLSSLRYLIIGGEEITAGATYAFMERFPWVNVVNLYGPTEASIGCVSYKVSGKENGQIPIGKPISNAKVLILDQRRRLAPLGGAGEIYLTGVCLGLGYLNDERGTRDAFIDNPFPEIGYDRLYKTGDLARWLPDGNIKFLGRVDDQVKIRGCRIEPGEIEAKLRSLPEARQAVVLAREGASGDKRLVAYIVPQPGKALTADELRGRLKRELPDHMIPSVFVTLAEAPLTPNGKIDRRALLGIALPECESQAEYVAPRTAVEALVADVWAEALRIERFSVHGNFFDLGGHSLLATRVVSRIRKLLQVELPLRRLFEGPTVAELALSIGAILKEGAAMRAPSLKKASRNGAPPLSFAQQRLWFLDQLDPGTPAYNLPAAARLTGRLDVNAIERTLNEIVRRHESLRTTFVEVDGEPVQKIWPPSERRLEIIDLSDLPESEREAESERLAREEARLPFDLTRGPLLRARLIKLAEEEHVLLFTTHHIVSDGWSMEALAREVGALYSAYSRGQESPLEELPAQYADYAAWQREWLQGEALEEQLGYWRERLGGELPVLELPADRPRPATPSYRGGRERMTVSAEIAERLKRLGREEGATLMWWSGRRWRTGRARRSRG